MKTEYKHIFFELTEGDAKAVRVVIKRIEYPTYFDSKGEINE